MNSPGFFYLNTMTAQKKGRLLGLVGIFILAPDSLVLRLVDCDDNAVIAIRAVFLALVAAAMVLFFPALRRGFRWRPILLYSFFFAAGLVSFPLSISNTHVANTLVIITITPILAAIGAHFFLHEKTETATWITAIVIFVGIGIIFSGSLSGGYLYGDALALGTAVTLAGGALVVRKNQDVSIYPGLVFGSLLAAMVASPWSDWQTVDTRDFALLALNGGGIGALSFLLIVAAARLLPPAELGLLFLLETLLGPLWVWIVLNEVPPLATLAAGALILATLTIYSLRQGKPSPAP